MASLRGDVEASGQALDDLDDLLAPEAVVLGEFDELLGPGEHDPALGVDGQGVVHRMAFTFIAYAKIMLSKPVSTAALRDYQRALRAEARTMKRLAG